MTSYRRTTAPTDDLLHDRRKLAESLEICKAEFGGWSNDPNALHWQFRDMIRDIDTNLAGRGVLPLGHVPI